MPLTASGSSAAASSATVQRLLCPTTTHGSPTSSVMYATTCSAHSRGVRGGSSQPPSSRLFMRGFGLESPMPMTSIACSVALGEATAHASRRRPQNVRSMPTPIGGSSTTGGSAGEAADAGTTELV